MNDKQLDKLIDDLENISDKEYIIVFENEDSIKISIEHDKRNPNILTDDELIEEYLENNYGKNAVNYETIILDGIESITI